MSETPAYQRFFAELKRRKVFRVMAVYGGVAFVILQVADIALPALGLPEWTLSLILLLDAHAEKYELQDQDWRKQKPWYQPGE